MKIPSVDPAFACRRVGRIDNDFQAFFDTAALDAILAHSRSRTDRSVGGILIGAFGSHSRMPFIRVEGYAEAPRGVGSNSGFKMPGEAWADITLAMEEKWPAKMMVGWHYSHIGAGASLTQADLEFHKAYFGQPWQIAMVSDPIREMHGVYRWKDKFISETGFFVVDKANS